MAGEPTITPLDKVVSKLAFSLRKKRGLTQEKLAEAIGTSNGMISSLESNKRGWGLEWIYRYSQFFKIEPWHLFADPDDLNTYPKIDRPILVIFRSLDDAGRSELLEYASFKLAALNRERNKI